MQSYTYMAIGFTDPVLESDRKNIVDYNKVEEKINVKILLPSM